MFCHVNGVRLYFAVEGAGLVTDGAPLRQKPALVLLHGAGFRSCGSLSRLFVRRSSGAAGVSPGEIARGLLPARSGEARHQSDRDAQHLEKCAHVSTARTTNKAASISAPILRGRGDRDPAMPI